MNKREFLKAVGFGLSIKPVQFVYRGTEIEIKKPYDVLEHGIIFSGTFYDWTNIKNIEFISKNK